ncbi:MAG TPA: hypothetical protein VJV74_05205 [Terriglobia bacterium]|nr:hypothetical protein [Terriglobia bacterium]
MDNDVKLLWVIPINTCSRRRGLVVTFYASLVLGCLFSRLIQSPSEQSLGLYERLGLWAGMVAGFLFWVACFDALVRMLRDYGLIGSHLLHTSRDERQEQVRHAAYVRAYRILMTLVCVTGAVILSSGVSRILRLTLGLVGRPLAPAAIVLAVTLPSVVIAWTEPDLKEA